MNVISLHQPYASLVMDGIKTWETRPAPPNGDMRPDGVRGLPGRRVNAGDRIAVHAASQWAPGWLRWHSDGSATLDALADVGADIYEDHNGSYAFHPVREGLPLGVIIGTVRVVDVLPIVGDRLDAVGQPGDDTEAILVGDGTLDIGDLNGLYRDITDQLLYGYWQPGGWAWELSDPIPTTEQCPVCAGKPKSPSTRTEGGGSFCRHCNSTRTFNFIDRPGSDCRCEGARRESCPVCLGVGSCPPIPAKGKQGVWQWTT